MHLFGLLGTLSFLLGFIMTLYVIIVKMVHIFNETAYRQITDHPLFYLALLAMVLGTQLFLAGFLGDLISRNSSERNNYQIETEFK